MTQLMYSVEFTSYGAWKSVFQRCWVDSNFDFSHSTDMEQYTAVEWIETLNVVLAKR